LAESERSGAQTKSRVEAERSGAETGGNETKSGVVWQGLCISGDNEHPETNKRRNPHATALAGALRVFILVCVVGVRCRSVCIKKDVVIKKKTWSLYFFGWWVGLVLVGR